MDEKWIDVMQDLGYNKWRQRKSEETPLPYASYRADEFVPTDADFKLFRQTLLSDSF